jgi:hypothetical protein
VAVELVEAPVEVIEVQVEVESPDVVPGAGGVLLDADKAGLSDPGATGWEVVAGVNRELNDSGEEEIVVRFPA